MLRVNTNERCIRARHGERRGPYLLDLPVCRNGPLGVSLVLEPGADGLQRPVGTAPAVVIHPILHVVMVAIQALDHMNLRKKDRV